MKADKTVHCMAGNSARNKHKINSQRLRIQSVIFAQSAHNDTILPLNYMTFAHH